MLNKSHGTYLRGVSSLCEPHAALTRGGATCARRRGKAELVPKVGGCLRRRNNAEFSDAGIHFVSNIPVFNKQCLFIYFHLKRIKQAQMY